MANEFPYGIVAQHLLAGEVIPFLGAAASMYHRSGREDENAPPTGAELAKRLADLNAYRDEINPKRYPCHFRWVCNRSRAFLDLADKQAPDLPLVASFAARVQGDCGTLQACLSDAFKRPFPPNDLHCLLAKIAARKPLLIVTTNYDDMLERAFDDANVPHHWVCTTMGEQEDTISIKYKAPSSNNAGPLPNNSADIDLTCNSIIYKMHGSIDRHDPSNNSYLITEEDYISFLSKQQEQIIPTFIGNHFRNNRFLFLGYSLRDWNFKVLLHKVQEDKTRYKDRRNWAVLLGSHEVEKQLWSRKQVEIYEKDLKEFIYTFSSEILRRL